MGGGGGEKRCVTILITAVKWVTVSAVLIDSASIVCKVVRKYNE